MAYLLNLYRNPTFRAFLRIASSHRWLYAGPIATQLALTALALAFADVTRQIFDKLSLAYAHLWSFILALAALAVLRAAITIVDGYLQSVLNETVVFDMRRSVLDHLLRVPIAYHEKHHSSHSAQLMYYQLEIAKDTIVSSIQRLITIPLSFMFCAAYLLHITPILGAIALLVGPLQLLSSLILAKRFERATEATSKTVERVFRNISEMLQGVREVKGLQQEEQSDATMGRFTDAAVKAETKLAFLKAARDTLRDLPNQIGLICGFIAAVIMAGHGLVRTGELIAFITLLDRISVPFVSMVGVLNSAQRTVAGAKNLMELMEIPVEDKKLGDSVPPIPTTITFDNVSFSYDGSRDVLSDVSFTIPAGTSLAIVGPSGGGKTTLVKLLFRLYEPTLGTIRLNGRPLSDYSMASLRDHVAIVSQDIHLFDGTISDNLRLGNAAASHEEMVRAVTLAEAYSFIVDLPDGFDTLIGERGVRLSQGQKQRLGIARAILRHASVIVLDEPTSALDVGTEALFQQSFGLWAGECTKITVAHRLSTIRDADLVLFLEKGRVIELDSPQALLADPAGRFYAFYHSQNLLFPLNDSLEGAAK